MANKFDEYARKQAEFENSENGDNQDDTLEGDALSMENLFSAEQLQLTDEELLALCKERLCSVCNEKEQADEERLRVLAEMDNFKKRIAREQEEFRKYAGESVLADLLPVLDNLELALEHGAKVDACKDVVLGVDMTRKIFLETLERHGLVPLGAVGEPFNPEIYEAVGEEARADMEPGHVAQLYQRGYKLKERLLRPAKAVVSKAE